jgi:hypothetical protein
LHGRRVAVRRKLLHPIVLVRVNQPLRNKILDLGQYRREGAADRGDVAQQSAFELGEVVASSIGHR